jgi:hypothetical protein
MSNKKVRAINIENDVIIGRVYKLYDVIDNKIYIGSTTLTLIKRLGDHMYSYNIGTDMELYHHMRLIDLKNFKMKLLEWKHVDNVQELRQLE